MKVTPYELVELFALVVPRERQAVKTVESHADTTLRDLYTTSEIEEEDIKGWQTELARLQRECADLRDKKAYHDQLQAIDKLVEGIVSNLRVTGPTTDDVEQAFADLKSLVKTLGDMFDLDTEGL